MRMDLSAYYDKFQSTYNLALFAVFFTLFVAIFCCVRTVKDKSAECRPVWRKVVYCAGYMFIFGFVLWLFFKGPYLMKKDVEQQAIYAYEGKMEIVELVPGFYRKAVFMLDGEEVRLVYSTDSDDYDFDITQPGEYTGKLIYSRNLSHVLDIEIFPTEGE